MSDEEYKKIFSKNLNFFLELNGKTQIDLINDLGLNKSAVSTWCNGTRLPRMDKVDMLAKYFGVNRSDLLEDKHEQQQNGYYIDRNTAQAAQEMFENRELRVLYDVERNMGPDDLNALYAMALALKKKERRDDNDA